jgi:adenylate cyclase class 2
MQHEYETKIIDINVAEIEEKLQKLGAVLTKPETLMKRRVFDIEPHVGNYGKRIRLREERGKTTLTYKERAGIEVGSTQELETEIPDFETMAKIMQKIERKDSAYMENKRKVYVRNNVEFCIDTRPMIPSYLEVEAPSKEQVEEVLKLI